MFMLTTVHVHVSATSNTSNNKYMYMGRYNVGALKNIFIT